MLIRYSVENFKSIRDKVELSMEAVGISELKETLITGKDGENYLPLAAIYGPNGGGKTNVLQSLYCLCAKIVFPIVNSLKGVNNRLKIINMKPFLFNDVNKDKPINFEIDFSNKLGEYNYILSIKNEKIIYEKLEMVRFSTRRTTELFARNGNVIKVSGIIPSIQHIKELSDKIPLISFLGILYGENEFIEDVIDWWLNRLSIADFSNPYTENSVSDIKDKKTRKLFLDLLKEMDVPIKDYEVIRKDTIIDIYTIHNVDGKDRRLNILDESSGSRKIFAAIPLIISSLLDGSTLVMDELDARLHPLMLKRIIELFNDKSSNSNGAQLIFTSHDMFTMSNELLRRDEIWFAAKGNSEDTQLYSLIDFKGEGEIKTETVRKDAKYSKQYLEGKYGADPYFQRIINWDEVHNEQKTE